MSDMQHSGNDSMLKITVVTVVVILNALLTIAMWGVDAGARFGG